MKFWTSALADTVAVWSFAVIGRRSHGELSDLAGSWHTAWPFLAGAAIGTVVSRSWRRPGSLSSGVVIWPCTLIGGMVLRVLSGNTVAVSFVVVAGIVLAAFLLGWRGLYALLRRTRSRSDVIFQREGAGSTATGVRRVTTETAAARPDSSAAETKEA